MRLFTKLHTLMLELVGSHETLKIARAVVGFATAELRFDCALLAFSAHAHEPLRALAWHGFTRSANRMVRDLALEAAAPSPALPHSDSPLTWPGPQPSPELAAIAAGLELSSFSAYRLSSSASWRGVVLAGHAAGESAISSDNVSAKGLAHLASLASALFGSALSMLALDRERAELERRVDERTRELSTALDAVTQLSRTDPLTKVLNRRAFRELAVQAVSLARRYQRCFALVVLDVDHFKSVNDTYGHHVGDAVLVAVAAALSATIRETDCVCRLGGEEFCVLLAESNAPAAAIAGERLRAALKGVAWSQVLGVPDRAITASFGIATYPDHADDLDALLGAADTAMYAAKRGGRNAIVMFERPQ